MADKDNSTPVKRGRERVKGMIARAKHCDAPLPLVPQACASFP